VSPRIAAYILRFIPDCAPGHTNDIPDIRV
jgi:hypothetical protein